MNLYELTEQARILQEWAQDPEVDAKTLADTMESLDGEIADKLEACAKVVKNLQADEAALKVEAARLEEKARVARASIDRIKKMMQTAMEQTGKRKIKGELFSFGIQKNPAAVVVDAEPRNIPADFLIWQEPKVNKEKLKKALEAGEDLHGIAHLSQTESLRIR